VKAQKVPCFLTASTRAIWAASLVLWAAMPTRAHHSGAMFDMQHLITLKGVVTRVEWTNPHAFFYLNVKDENGAVQEWAIEINSPNFLKHNGWTSSTVNPGDTITCTGAPAKTGARFMHGTMVELASGVELRS
jgi:hypothetical protein